MSEHALWQRLDRAGHDAALLRANGTGWLLTGAAAYLHENGPASLTYEVHLNEDWSTRQARISGFVGERAIGYSIERSDAGWTLDGSLRPDLSTAVDIDFGFTPATNLAQLRRENLSVGQSTRFFAAWFDVDKPSFMLLPQHYHRKDEFSYAYESPTFDYRATLRLDPSGFIAEYPGLWAMQPSHA